MYKSNTRGDSSQHYPLKSVKDDDISLLLPG